MPMERRGRVTRVRSTGQRETGGARRVDGRRQSSVGGTSRVTGDSEARFSEGLGCNSPGLLGNSLSLLGKGCRRWQLNGPVEPRQRTLDHTIEGPGDQVAHPVVGEAAHQPLAPVLLAGDLLRRARSRVGGVFGAHGVLDAAQILAGWSGNRPRLRLPIGHLPRPARRCSIPMVRS